MALVTVYDACVFPTPNSWKVMTKLKEVAPLIQALLKVLDRCRMIGERGVL